MTVPMKKNEAWEGRREDGKGGRKEGEEREEWEEKEGKKTGY